MDMEIKAFCDSLTADQLRQVEEYLKSKLKEEQVDYRERKEKVISASGKEYDAIFAGKWQI